MEEYNLANDNASYSQALEAYQNDIIKKGDLQAEKDRINAVRMSFAQFDRFKIGDFGIHYYSLMFIIAFSLGYYLMKNIFYTIGSLLILLIMEKTLLFFQNLTLLKYGKQNLIRFSILKACTYQYYFLKVAFLGTLICKI